MLNLWNSLPSSPNISPWFKANLHLFMKKSFNSSEFILSPEQSTQTKYVPSGSITFSWGILFSTKFIK